MLTRRTLLAASASAAAVAAPAAAPEPLSICAFSKHFHWTDVSTMAALCAEMGYEGIDLTLRPAGHVLPERAADDLPKAAEAIRKAGLRLAMTTAGIVDATTPHCETMLKAMQSVGLRRYRWGGFRYDFNQPLTAQLDQLRPKVRDLAAMNRHYGLCAMYHTHSGRGQVGASFWDLHWILKDQDPEAVSANIDIGHAVAEGGYGGWYHSCKLLLPLTKGVAVKDFLWTRNARGEWVPGWCALGQGMVNFREFFTLLKESRFSGPLQLHMEYPELGGADKGNTTFTIPRERLLAIFRRDLDALKKLMSEAGLRA